MALWSYSPQDVTFLVAGFYQVVGFTDGTFISIEKDVAPYQTTRTSDGITARTYTMDDTYTITLTLSQGSPANDLLTKLSHIDRATQMGKFPLFIKDLKGSSLFLSATTWIQDIPSLSYSTSIQGREWVLQSSQASINVGNNEDTSSIFEDVTSIITGSVPSTKKIL